jgi:hypothetical protein
MLWPIENESRRLDELYALDIFDTAPEERFDRLTRLARQIFDVPIALVSLVDHDRQWFKSRQGLDRTETPLVAENPRVRFYAGAVLKSGNGLPLGTL